MLGPKVAGNKSEGGIEASSNTGILHLGSGRKYLAGAVNVDLTEETKPDVVHNLNQTPWPFETSNFAEIRAYDVLEHLDDLLRSMGEIHRVGRRGAVLKATVPHYSSDGAYTDPTHKLYFGYRTFEYFTEGHSHSFYTDARFRIRARNLVFRPHAWNKVVHRLASRFPTAWEERWAWMFPAWFVYVELEILK